MEHKTFYGPLNNRMVKQEQDKIKKELEIEPIQKLC